MKKINFTTVRDLEKMNSTEIQNIKGGVSTAVNNMRISGSSADSHDHDSKKKDHFSDASILF